MKPDLSIVIVNYNTKKLTLDCIDSVVRSKPKVSFEIIIIDNGSPDDSVSQFKKLAANHWPLTIIENKENLGFAKAVNQGIKVAKGEYVLLLNSDTKVKKGTIDKLVDFAGETLDAGVVGARLLNFDGSVQPSCYNFPSIKNAILTYWYGKRNLFDKFAPSGNLPHAVDAVVGATFLITPKALKEVGPLNEQFFMYFEDIDYCREVKNAGLAVYYLPSAEAVHYHGKSGDVAGAEVQRQRLIASSKIYHGLIGYYLLTPVILVGQKWQKYLKN